MSILSIQSLVAYGHAGNRAAVFPLQRLGKVVWPVMTVHFSNHTGYGDWKGPLLSAADVAEVIAGVGDRGAFERCEAVLSGYQGAEDVGSVILDAVATVKAASPDAIYCCDPVMGDVGRGMFVRPGHPGVHARPGGACSRRDHAQPLRARLPGRFHDHDVRRAARRRRHGARRRTGHRAGHQRDRRRHSRRRAGHGRDLGRRRLADPLPAALGQPTRRRRPHDGRVPGAPARGRPLDVALARTTAAVFAVVSATADAGERELRIVQSQDELAAPTRSFEVERLR